MPSIIASLQVLARGNHRLLGARATRPVSDLAWGLGSLAGREGDWGFRVWEDESRTVAWSWRHTGILGFAR